MSAPLQKILFRHVLKLTTLPGSTTLPHHEGLFPCVVMDAIPHSPTELMTIREFIEAKTQRRYAEITEMPQEEGGFGRLYKAIDTNPTTSRASNEVCIKVIKSNLSKELQMKLWQEEILALRFYRNRSGIVHLVEPQYHFERDEPYWFLVMEYVHGSRLGSSKYRIELNVEEDQAIRIIFQLCSVIFSMHQRGKYHQDIFPDNVKVLGEHLILLDLGGMREAERRSGTIIFGGEMYSPPEVSPTRLRMKRFRTLRKQKMGSFESADIFSIGAIFYELLLGVPFFENIEQSNQLKEYIYDYYTDPAMVQRMKQEYLRALNLAKRNIQNFQDFLVKYPLPLELAECCANMLAVHPQKRPSIERILELFIPYLIGRVEAATQKKQWAQADLWNRYVERHFDEILLESVSDDGVFRQKMLNHLVLFFPHHFQSYLLQGFSAFHQTQIDVAQQIYTKAKDALERYQPHYPDKAWGTMFLKTLNNLGVCYAKRQQPHEAAYLFKTLSTAQGNLGQIITRNAQVCTTVN